MVQLIYVNNISNCITDSRIMASSANSALKCKTLAQSRQPDPHTERGSGELPIKVVLACTQNWVVMECVNNEVFVFTKWLRVVFSVQVVQWATL